MCNSEIQGIVKMRNDSSGLYMLNTNMIEMAGNVGNSQVLSEEFEFGVR